MEPGEHPIGEDTVAIRPTVLCVVGARPNFIKASALLTELNRAPALGYKLVHTGQHYDDRMSGQFFQQLGIPQPDLNLGVGSGSHAVQTARVMEAFEPVLIQEKPAMVVVFGDVNSTIACALTAVKLGVPVAHVEAGLRSFDRTMPEEITRVLTDAISDLLFTTEQSGSENLQTEGVPSEKIKFVGNVMIDTLLSHRSKAEESSILATFGAEKHGYALLTLHRPANVDSAETLKGLLDAMQELARVYPVIFPCHPRTLAVIEQHDLLGRVDQDGALKQGRIRVCAPLGYLDFIKLVADSRLVLTDSGGLQEETTILGVPCLTLRENTERPVTVTHGTNEIVGVSRERIVESGLRKLNGRPEISKALPPLWDGHASERIVAHLASALA